MSVKPHLNRGDILYRVDPAPFEAALHAAEPSLLPLSCNP